jgi:26S proteasome non-ATPase regulatory subunit 10
MATELINQLAYDGKIEALQKELMVDPNKATMKFQDERQPLHWACSGGHDVIVDYLLSVCNVPVDDADDSGWTPLIIASSAGHDNIVKTLLQRDANPNKTTATGQTALHYAASRNRFKIAEMLISCNCDVNVADDTTSATPLHRAASKGNLKIVRLLTENSCKFDSVDIEGNTALHLACEEERTEVAELLHQCGASLTVLNKDKKSPLDLSPPYLKRRLTGD